MSDIYLSLTETPTVVTLSQPVVSGVLASTVTVANTVTVALDSNSLSALENVTVTVGAAVSISNFPASQVVSVSNFPASAPVTVANFPSVTTVSGTVALDAASLVALENITVTVGAAVALAAGSAQVGSVSISNFPATQTIAGTVTVGNSVTISSLPAISGTVTANGFDFNNSSYHPIPLAPFDEGAGGGKAVVAKIIDNNGVGLNLSAGVPISGTVTANFAPQAKGPILEIDSAIPNDPKHVAIVGGFDLAGAETRALRLGSSGEIIVSSVTIGSLPAISGTVTASNLSSVLDQYDINNQEKSFSVAASISGQGYVSDSAKVNITNSVTIGSLPAISGTVTVGSMPAISGTVTVGAMPNGALTTRFGTPTNANTSFATAAVTNSARKYLLIQNVTTQSNVITVGIGFTPTTTQGIQLTAGAGITFESSYIPTGAVHILSSVTASNFTILEA